MPDAGANLKNGLQNKQNGTAGERAEIKTQLNEVLISQLPSDVQTAAGIYLHLKKIQNSFLFKKIQISLKYGCLSESDPKHFSAYNFIWIFLIV